MGIAWDYEPDTYDLGPELGWYLPDFYLPLFDVFCEAKPGTFNKIEEDKCQALYRLTGRGVILLEGPPQSQTYRITDTELYEDSKYMDLIIENFKGQDRFFMSIGDPLERISIEGQTWGVDDAVELSKNYKGWEDKRK
jgi:hypothetical protein